MVHYFYFMKMFLYQDYCKFNILDKPEFDEVATVSFYKILRSHAINNIIILSMKNL